MSPVSNVSMGEGSQICTALRTGARASRIKSGTEIGGGAADKGGGGGVSDVWIGVKRGMGIRLGRDRGEGGRGWAEENCRTTPPGQNDPLFAYFIFLISRRCRSCQFC